MPFLGTLWHKYIFWCRELDLNQHERKAHQILSLARLPIPPSRHKKIYFNEQGKFIFLIPLLAHKRCFVLNAIKLYNIRSDATKF